MSYYITRATPFADEVITGLTGASTTFLAVTPPLKRDWWLQSRWDFVDNTLTFSRTYWVLFQGFDDPQTDEIELPLHEFIEELKEVL